MNQQFYKIFKIYKVFEDYTRSIHFFQKWLIFEKNDKRSFNISYDEHDNIYANFLYL